MKYRCLVLDHDDTVVNSTEEIHYKSFIEYLKIYRPEFADAYPLPLFLEKNFDIGLMEIFRTELSMSEEEIAEEGKFWESYVEERIPGVFEGIAEVLHEYARRGGIIAVCTHSNKSFIFRDYAAGGLPIPLEVYAYDGEESLRKPSPKVIFDLCEKYALEPSEILVVDDLKVGWQMARAAGIDFAAAGWAYDVPIIRDFMENHSDFYLESVEELSKLLFDND